MTDFAVPAITEPELRDLYRWNCDLLLLAWDNARKASYALGDHPDGDIVGTTVRLFHMIGAGSKNAEHEAAIDAVSDRLYSARMAELQLGIATEAELLSMIEAAASENVLTFRNRIELYHLHRQSLAGRIVQAMYRPPTPPK